MREAFATHCPELPLAELRAVFGAKVSMLRSPSVDYGHDPFPYAGVPPSPPVLRWKKKGSKRVPIIEVSPQGR